MIKQTFFLLLLLCLSNTTRTVNYPVRAAYIDSINLWWPTIDIVAGMGAPGFAPSTMYNYIIFAFWLSTGPSDMVDVWSNPVKYIGSSTQFGVTNQQIQVNLKNLYNNAGIKVMVSAFGAS